MVPPPDSPGQASAPGGPNPKAPPALPSGAHLANGPAENGGQGAAAAELAAAAAAALAAAVAAAQRGGGGDAKEVMTAVRSGLARLVEAVGPDQEVWYYLDPQARLPGTKRLLARTMVIQGELHHSGRLNSHPKVGSCAYAATN